MKMMMTMTLAQSLPTIHSKTTVDLCSHSQTARVLGQQPSLFAALPFSQRKDAGLLKGQLLCWYAEYMLGLAA